MTSTAVGSSLGSHAGALPYAIRTSFVAVDRIPRRGRPRPRRRARRAGGSRQRARLDALTVRGGFPLRRETDRAGVARSTRSTPRARVHRAERRSAAGPRAAKAARMPARSGRRSAAAKFVPAGREARGTRPREGVSPPAGLDDPSRPAFGGRCAPLRPPSRCYRIERYRSAPTA